MNASSMARVLGRRGGLTRARRLSPAARKQIASLGGQARRESIAAARSIADNFRYAATVDILRGGVPPIRRLNRAKGRLPGLYR